MFTAWGHFVYRWRWSVLIVSALLLVGSGYIASQGGKLESGGFIETAESGRASRLIEKELPRAGGSTFTLIFTSATLTANDPAFKSAVDDALAPLRPEREPRVAMIQTPYDGSVADPTAIISKDQHSIAVNVAAKDDIPTARGYYQELRAKARSDKLDVQATGVLAINNGFNVILEEDLRRAEIVSLPLALILLLLVFGTVVAAFIPLFVGVLAVMGGVAGMFLLTRVTTVSVMSLGISRGEKSGWNGNPVYHRCHANTRLARGVRFGT